MCFKLSGMWEEDEIKVWNHSFSLKASYTVEAGIVCVFLITFLGMAISYEINHMDQILGVIQKEQRESESWRLGKEVEQYLKYRELKEIVDDVIGGK